MPRNMLQRGKKAKRSMVAALSQRVDEENENSVSWLGACEQFMAYHISLGFFRPVARNLRQFSS